MTRLTWAVVGASNIAETQVVPAMRAAGHEVAAVVSSSRERVAAFAGDLGVEAACGGVGELTSLARPVDAVYISSRNRDHAQQAVAAAEAGFHVLCEKPLATSLTDAVAMIDACSRNRVVLATNHHLREARGVQLLREVITDGTLGEIIGVHLDHAMFLPAELRTWRLDGNEVGNGVALDMGVHDADVLRFITGREITSVASVFRGGSEGFAGDSVSTSFLLEGDLLASCFASFSVPHGTTHATVHGDRGSLHADDVLTRTSSPTVTVTTGSGTKTYNIPRDAHSWDVYERTLRRFAAAVDTTGRPAATGEDGLRSLQAGLAMQRSWLDGTVVQLGDQAGTTTSHDHTQWSDSNGR